MRSYKPEEVAAYIKLFTTYNNNFVALQGSLGNSSRQSAE